MELPELFQKRTYQLLKENFESFLQALELETPVSIRINNSKITHAAARERVNWCNSGYYLEKRPVFTMDPLFHAGCYYVQEAGSMFLEQAVKQNLTVENPIVLDLCAAPGGKSTHLADLLDGKGLLVSNEVIRSRSKILQENVIKWGASNVVVTNNDPAEFSGLNGFFDMLVVDAPCSGEGMFRKDPQSVNEWSVEHVDFCADRQRRILSDVLPALKTDGILVYSTCTYNESENEDNIKWLIEEHEFELLSISLDPSWGITYSGLGYRFYPHKTKGEGFFLSVLKKKKEEKQVRIKTTKNKNQLTKAPEEVKTWLLSNDFHFAVSPDGRVSAIPTKLKNEIDFLEDKLNVIYAGISVAKIKGKDLIPESSLAFSNNLNPDSFVIKDLSWKEAISFLKKDNLVVEELPKGWLLGTYKGYPLGWMKNLGARSNNLYPQEWRIRMEADEQKYTSLF